MRVLLASTAGAGHFGPLLPFADALARVGHDVELVVPGDADVSVEGRGLRVTRGGKPDAEEMRRLSARFAGSGRAQQRRLAERELFARRCTEAMLPSLREVVGRRPPDLVLREPCEYASAITAVQRQIPLATVAISFAKAEWSVLRLVSDLLERHLGGLSGAIAEAPFLTRLPASLDPSPFPRTLRYRDRVAGAVTEGDADPWQGREHPHLYLTFGSQLGRSERGPQLQRAALTAVGGLRAQVLFTVGRHVDRPALEPVPENVRVVEWAEQEAVLADCDLVVCHGGSGTTFGALAHGIPIGFIPLFADQPSNARRVAAAGAGLVLPATAGADGIPQIDASHAGGIRAMAEALLAASSYREAAQRLAEELAAQPAIAVVAATLTSAPTAG